MHRPPDLLPPDAYVRVFEHLPDGAQILDELTRVFVRPAKTSGGIDAVLETFRRDGQRSVIEWIVNRINQARGLPTEEGDNDDAA